MFLRRAAHYLPLRTHQFSTSVACLRKKEDDRLEHITFSRVDSRTLKQQFNIISCGDLIDRGNLADHVAWSISQGGKRYMSSKHMYRHLDFLENLVPKTGEVAAWLWVDTLFFRASAILSTSTPMVLSLEQPLSPLFLPTQGPKYEVAGVVDYIALMTGPSQHRSLLNNPDIFKKRTNLSGVFVAEAKKKATVLSNYIPQALVEMYSTAKHINKSIIRGAITNGHEWIFLILYLNESGVGGMYLKSRKMKIRVRRRFPYSVLSPKPDIIAGILARWIQRSFFDLDEGDWFCIDPNGRDFARGKQR